MIKDEEHARRVLRFVTALRELYAALDFYPELRLKLMKAIVDVVGEEAELLHAQVKQGLDQS